MYSCPTQVGETLAYNITSVLLRPFAQFSHIHLKPFRLSSSFCPDGTFPQHTQGGEIHPSYNPGKCLDVQGAIFANGTPVQVYGIQFQDT